MNKYLQPLTQAALYARVSSDRQDVDLSVSAQMRALKAKIMPMSVSLSLWYKYRWQVRITYVVTIVGRTG